MSGFPHLDEEGAKTLPIGIGGTLSECLAIENKVLIRGFRLLVE